MPVVSQSIISPMVPVGASTEAWRVADAGGGGELAGLVPALLGGAEQRGGDQLLVDLGGRLPVLASTRSMCSRVLGVAGEGAHAGGGAGRGGVGVAGHQRR